MAQAAGAAALVGVAPAHGRIPRTDMGKHDGLVPQADGWVTLDLGKPQYAALGQAGGAVKIAVKGQKRPVIAMRVSADEARALSSRCTHVGCEVDLPENGQMLCPCHGSSFSLDGTVTHGPAGSPLKTFATRLDAGAATLAIKVA
jgi:Rieske Fe-S protein